MALSCDEIGARASVDKQQRIEDLIAKQLQRSIERNGELVEQLREAREEVYQLQKQKDILQQTLNEIVEKKE